jgi:hypothetical protein
MLMMAGKLVGWEEGPSLAPFGEHWQEYRKVFSQYMGSRSKMAAFEPVLQEESHDLLKNILADPNAWLDQCHKYVSFHFPTQNPHPLACIVDFPVRWYCVWHMGTSQLDAKTVL